MRKGGSCTLAQTIVFFEGGKSQSVSIKSTIDHVGASGTISRNHGWQSIYRRLQIRAAGAIVRKHRWSSICVFLFLLSFSFFLPVFVLGCPIIDVFGFSCIFSPCWRILLFRSFTHHAMSAGLQVCCSFSLGVFLLFFSRLCFSVFLLSNSIVCFRSSRRFFVGSFCVVPYPFLLRLATHTRCIKYACTLISFWFWSWVYDMVLVYQYRVRSTSACFFFLPRETCFPKRSEPVL